MCLCVCSHRQCKKQLARSINQYLSASESIYVGSRKKNIYKYSFEYTHTHNDHTTNVYIHNERVMQTLLCIYILYTHSHKTFIIIYLLPHGGGCGTSYIRGGIYTRSKIYIFPSQSSNKNCFMCKVNIRSLSI